LRKAGRCRQSAGNDKKMSEKKQILKSIVAVARRMRRTPSLAQFVARARIPECSIMRQFGSWNEAVRAAGLEPCRLYVRPGNNELLKDWAEVVRKKGGLPSRSVYLVTGKYYPRTIEKRFGGWVAVPEAFRHFAKGKPVWADVVALLGDSGHENPLTGWTNLQGSRVVAKRRDWPRGRVHGMLQDRPVYGSPIDFRGVRHEPVNEQGVLLLFGMLARELGYSVESAQKGFPDCEAKRQITANRWQRVRIEFEFESKNFREHGHAVNGCDVIVCWRHNWEDCPRNIEVVELSSVIESLASV